MRLLYVLVFVCFLASCGSNSATGKQLSGADSLIIHFNDAQTNAIINTINSTEAKAIKKLKQFVGGKEAQAYKCGYNGNVQFYAKGALLGDFSFNYQDGCKHFIQLNNDKLSSTAMSNEAADFLKSLAEGKNSY